MGSQYSWVDPRPSLNSVFNLISTTHLWVLWLYCTVVMLSWCENLFKDRQTDRHKNTSQSTQNRRRGSSFYSRCLKYRIFPWWLTHTRTRANTDLERENNSSHAITAGKNIYFGLSPFHISPLSSWFPPLILHFFIQQLNFSAGWILSACCQLESKLLHKSPSSSWKTHLCPA